MDFHILDWIVWLLGCWLIFKISPDEGLESLAGLIRAFFWTVACIVFFGAFGFNASDLFSQISISL